MTTRTATLMAAFVAAAALVSPAAAQTDTAKVAPAAPAAAPAAATTPAAAPAPRPRRNRNEILRADMEEKGARNVYDGVRMIRSSFLRASRSMSSSTQQNPVLAVYRDGAPLSGGVNALRDIAVESIAKVEYLEPQEAVQRFGTGASGGALLLHSGH